MRRAHWNRVRSTEMTTTPSKPPKLAAWLTDAPVHAQTLSSRAAAKAAAQEKRERRAAKWRERRV